MGGKKRPKKERKAIHVSGPGGGKREKKQIKKDAAKNLKTRKSCRGDERKTVSGPNEMPKTFIGKREITKGRGGKEREKVGDGNRCCVAQSKLRRGIGNKQEAVVQSPGVRKKGWHRGRPRRAGREKWGGDGTSKLPFWFS